MNKRLAGILQPVFAIRTSDDLGIGDTDGVRQLIDWCHRHDIHVLQILPINETWGDHCPYKALSALALNPLTLAISPRHIPDLTPEKFNELAPKKLLKKLRVGSVNYPRVHELKHKLLKSAFNQFATRHLRHNTERAACFHRFKKENSTWVCNYALFRALMSENNETPEWERWPAEHRSPQSARRWALNLPKSRRDNFARSEIYFTYVQWLAFGQWRALKQHAAARNVLLMGDMPVGIDRCSADVWSGRANFDLNWSGGAPPETLFKDDRFSAKWGQNWGVPLYRWEEMRVNNFEWWRARVGLAREIFSLCRIDHVMGLFRIYAFPWTPERNAEFLPLDAEEAAIRTGGRLPGFRPFPDDTKTHIAANRRRGEEFLRVILDAATDMAIVAEDLGVVPDYVRATLRRLAIPGFRVPSLFRDPDGRYSNPAKYPRLSVTQPATHDHPSLAAAWNEHWREIDTGKNGEENWRELRRAMEFAGLKNKPARNYSDSLHRATLHVMLKSKSTLAIFMLADVFAQTIRFNVPGTLTVNNWSARMPSTVEELETDPKAVAKTRSFSGLIRDTGRGSNC
jgi:4-alpha-glucanotransferase